jgi:TAG lipase / steryl ester hydrolase / phospholipase A2 / LPA acyltransferase
LLSGVLKRDHLGIHAEELHHKTAKGTKACIEAFQQEVERCLNTLVEADENEMTMQQKLAFFKKERRSLGQSAWCLSGGGSICMYHIGIMKALIDADMFRHIRVFSGASGGSIIAAAIAMMTEDELQDFVIQTSVATDFKHDGSQVFILSTHYKYTYMLV